MWVKCFLLISALIVLPIVFVSYFSIQYNIDTLVEQKRITDLQELTLLNTSINNFTDYVESVGNYISSTPEIKLLLNDTELFSEMQVADIINSYTDYFPNIRHISFLDSNQSFVNETQLDKGRLSWFFNPDTMKMILQKGALWSASYNIEFIDNHSVERVISYIQTVYQGNVVLGYVILYIPTQSFQTLLSDFSNTTLILEDDHFFASAEGLPYYQSFTQHYLINTAFFFNDTSAIVKTGQGPQIITTQNFQRLNLQFVTLSSYSEFREQIITSSPSVMMTAISSIFFVLIGSLILSRIITKPIIRLKKTMIEVQSGDMSVRAIVKGKDEVADLASHFNLLLKKIEELIASLNDRYKEHQHIQIQLIHEQIKPHFLYNILETINSLIRSDLKQESIKAVSNIAAFYRISLNSGRAIVTVNEEYELIKHYLELQHLRYIEFMDYTLAVSPDIMKYHIPKLTLQPLIENAIYHGIRKKGIFGTIFVSGYKENESVVFEIFDSGQGMGEETISKILADIQRNEYIDKHFGITSVVRRLRLFTNQDPIINISSIRKEYTCIQIKFPAIEGHNMLEREDSN